MGISTCKSQALKLIKLLGHAKKYDFCVQWIFSKDYCM